MSQAPKEWQELGSRLADARRTARLSQADVAAALRLDRTAITKIESGDRRVDSLELARLATVLGRPIDWFVTPPPPSIVSRRASRDTADDSQADVLLETVARDVALMIELNLLIPPRPPFRPGAPVETVETAEAAAGDLRRQLGLVPAPVWDLQRVVEQAGLYAFSIELETDSLDGSYVALDVGGAAVVNGETPTGRRRFTLAHELGHHILADKYSDEWILGVGGGERERLINAFAVHFLMPRDAVTSRWKALGGDRDPRPAAVVLGAEFGVSWTAACAQLRNLGLIDEVKRDQFEHDRPRKADYVEGGILLRDDLVPPAVPPMFGAAVVKAYRRHKLSAARAVEILRGTVSVDELPPEDVVPIDSMGSELDLG
ncbi:MAG: ImmA/IrrE family metallo-endopeptidase [Deltaproteobacteria bacterium]|nr:ImmA/IrrE family metallo-endopeptidase [Deltaproteobacteria bacterium]